MKDAEILNHLNEDWTTVNKLKNKLNCNWEKLLSQLRYLESKGLIESIEIKQKNNVYRHFRKPVTDEHKVSIIERTPVKERSNLDHKYLVQHKFKGNLREYINLLLEEING